MTNTEYRTALDALGLSQIAAAKVLGIGERTSRRYASAGVPERLSPYIRQKLNMVDESDKETDA